LRNCICRWESAEHSVILQPGAPRGA
jgi:hypothetical protein